MARKTDDSHQPFKSRKVIGPGPKRRRKLAVKDLWECSWVGKYKQACYNRATGRLKINKPTCANVPLGKGEKRISASECLVITKAKKKRYNKVYRAWAKEHRRAKLPLRAGYQCRPTPFAKCGGTGRVKARRRKARR
jgi:hypothetical protein